jgi:hypothetical protein
MNKHKLQKPRAQSKAGSKKKAARPAKAKPAAHPPLMRSGRELNEARDDERQWLELVAAQSPRADS